MINLYAAGVAVLVTMYFWWRNTKGIHESSDDALKIMYVTTVMVVLLIGWCIYTVMVRHSALPPLPYPRNLHLTAGSLGWLAHSSLPHMFGIIAIRCWRNLRHAVVKYAIVLLVTIEVILVGVARVALSAHYPSDVLAGFFGGIAALGAYGWLTRPGGFTDHTPDNATDHAPNR